MTETKTASIRETKRVLNEEEQFAESDLMPFLKRDDWHWTISKQVLQESIIRRVIRLQKIEMLQTVLDLGFKEVLLRVLLEEKEVDFCKSWLEELYLNSTEAQEKLLILKSLSRINK